MGAQVLPIGIISDAHQYELLYFLPYKELLSFKHVYTVKCYSLLNLFHKRWDALSAVKMNSRNACLSRRVLQGLSVVLSSISFFMYGCICVYRYIYFKSVSRKDQTRDKLAEGKRSFYKIFLSMQPQD